MTIISRDAFRYAPQTRVYRDFHSGELKTLTRRSARRNHEFLPEDQVQLRRGKNADWEQGEQVEVHHVGYKQPNIVQVRDAAGERTFVEAGDLEMVRRGGGHGLEPADDPRVNRYLHWP